MSKGLINSTEHTQTFLDQPKKLRLNKNLKILNWNIANPSIQKAQKQIRWLEKNNFDILILTEAKSSKGCIYLKDRLKSLNYDVSFPEVEEDYFVVIASKKEIKTKNPDIITNFLPHRAPSIHLKNKDILITGIYIPPSLSSKKRAEFHNNFKKILKNNKSKKWIILGDLNVPYPDSKKHKVYNTFLDYELVDAFRHKNPKKQDNSLFREKGAYRPDNIFISKEFTSSILTCDYIHEPRLNNLSDHSAMCLKLKNI